MRFKSLMSVACLLALVGATLPAGGCKSGGEIKIGALMDTSGALGGVGKLVLEAVQLAVQQVNAAGGVGGRQVVLFAEDGQTDPNAGYEAVKRLVGVDGCKVIIGPMISGTVLAAGDYILGQKVLMISPSATSADIADQNFRQLMFRTVTSDALQARAIAQLVADAGYQRVSILAVNNSYGTSLASGVSSALAGKATVVSTTRYDPAKTDYQTELQALKTKAPDCVVHIGYPADAAIIYEQALALGLDGMHWIATDGVYSNDLLADPQAAEFMSRCLIGTRATAPEGLAAYAEFAAAFQAAYGEAPGVFCENAYDATDLALLAMKKAGTVDTSKISAEVLKLADNYPGASGAITLDTRGDRVSGDYEVWKVAVSGGIYSYQRVKVISLS